MAEGRYNTPELAKAAIEIGADCVHCWFGIDSLEHIVSWFVTSVKSAKSYQTKEKSMRCLAIDIGGTKIATAVVEEEAL